MKKLERPSGVIVASCILGLVLIVGFLIFKVGALEARVTLLEKSQDEVLDRIDASSDKLVGVIENWERVGKEQPIVIKLRNPYFPFTRILTTD